MSDRYVLDGKIAVLEPDKEKWWNWYQSANQTVGRAEIGKFIVSKCQQFFWH